MATIHHFTFKKGDTSKSINIEVQDSSVTTGVGLTGLAYNTGSLLAYYDRQGAAEAVISLVTQTVTGAWTSGGFVEIGATHMKGLYRLDIPDAVLASGVDRAYIILQGAANMTPAVVIIHLVAYDPEDTTLGMKGEIADEIGDELLADHVGAGSFGAAFNYADNLPGANAIAAAVLAALAPVSGTAQAGGASTIQLAASASAVDSTYVGYVVIIVGGTGAGEAREVASYVGATRTATVTGAWSVNPDNTSKYILVAC